jgi:xylulokinase
MVGAGEYLSVEDATEKIVKTGKCISPVASLVEKYEKKYRKFQQMYPALKNVFHGIGNQV